jgi:ABC-type amino acid transport system permease subunit
MKKSIKYTLAIFLISIADLAFGQNAEMADTFRAEGKIYVVVAIILIVLTGLITYLFLLDRKLNKLERMIHAKKQTKQAGKSF